MKKAILIHRWSGNPESDWYSWLKKELESKGFSVEVPEMPDTDKPKIEPWVNKLKEVCPNPENIILIGHSIGCQTILRYLESKESAEKVILIAPWMHLQGLEEEPESAEIAEPWLMTPIDFEKIKGKFTCIFSDNDYFVPLSDKEIFKEKLDAEIIVEHEKGHFTEDDGVTELPSALNSI